MSDSPHHEAEVFAQALRLPIDERAAFLTGACGNDGEMRKRLEALLQIQARVGDFLEDPDQDSGVGALLDIASGVPEKRVGRYNLLEKIGEGGCGVIYLAEQEEPVRRQVALKIIKPGMATKDVIARFEAERQALALMDHPGIAKVFDAGETESGRPYFVMELIRGIKITEYCDQNSLTTEERLKLFILVCEAIQHAHQKGVIHRDIKPSNILVTAAPDGTAQPVVIDFGIAKATNDLRLTEKTLFTAVEMLIGTPTYMSPEQTAFTSADVDTRSDIYSLGVLLYELLTGSTPFDAGELLQLGIDEVRRAIREQEPPRPSARLSKMTGETLTGVAKHRRAEPRTLIRSMRGDLDWIVMKTLEKDRARRYESASGLSLDVKRFLSDETVTARPASVGYRLQKTVVRHKLFFIGATMIALLLVASLVVISESLAKERAARREADAARQQAEMDKAKAQAEAAKSQQVTKFLEGLLNGVDPSVARGRDTTLLREILDQAVARIDAELSGQPATTAELQSIIGHVYRQLDAFDRAEAMYRAALAGYRKLFGRDSKEVAASLTPLGETLSRLGKYSEAEAVLRDALAIRRQLFGDDHADVAATMFELASVLHREGNEGEAEILIRATLVTQRKLLGTDHADVATTLIGLATLCNKLGRYSEAEAAQREALAIRRKRFPVGDAQIASAISNLCWTLSQGSNLDGVEELAREALDIRRKTLGNESTSAAASLSILSQVLRREKKYAEAQAAIREAIAIDRKLLGEKHSTTLQMRQDLGGILGNEGRLAEAESVLRDSLQARLETQGRTHIDVGLELADLGEVLFKRSNFAEAEINYRESIAVLRKAVGPKSPVLASSLTGLGAVLHQNSRDGEAEAILREATTIEYQVFGDGNPRTVRSLGLLRAVLEAQGKTTEADTIRSEMAKGNPGQPPAVTIEAESKQR